MGEFIFKRKLVMLDYRNATTRGNLFLKKAGEDSTALLL